MLCQADRPASHRTRAGLHTTRSSACVRSLQQRAQRQSLGGIAHFVATDAEVSVAAPYAPSPRAAVWVNGAFELLGAAGLLFGSTQRVTVIGLSSLTIVVTTVHIYMLQRPELFDVPYWVFMLRLPRQVASLAVITWSTFSDRSSERQLACARAQTIRRGRAILQWLS